jgi:hypothetical protein
LKSPRPVSSDESEAKLEYEHEYVQAVHDRSDRGGPGDVRIDPARGDRVMRSPGRHETKRNHEETAREAVPDVTRTVRRLSHELQKVQ